MLYSYDELSIGFEFLGALEVSINFQTSDIRLWLQSSYQKYPNSISPVAVLCSSYPAATQCISVFK